MKRKFWAAYPLISTILATAALVVLWGFIIYRAWLTF